MANIAWQAYDASAQVRALLAGVSAPAETVLRSLQASVASSIDLTKLLEHYRGDLAALEAVNRSAAQVATKSLSATLHEQDRFNRKVFEEFLEALPTIDPEGYTYRRTLQESEEPPVRPAAEQIAVEFDELLQLPDLEVERRAIRMGLALDSANELPEVVTPKKAVALIIAVLVVIQLRDPDLFIKIMEYGGQWVTILGLAKAAWKD